MNANYLNENCTCQTFDSEVLKKKLESNELFKGLYDQIVIDRPNLFSSTSVFISSEQLSSMTAIITAIEEAVDNPGFKKIILDRSPAISNLDMGTKGVFMGYDFHLDDEGPKLIEVNTNAGGALLNLELAKAQQECCQESDYFFKYLDELSNMDKLFYDMFIHEWKLQRGDKKINLIAIVDDDPELQYLYVEFQLFQRLFEKFGVKAIIVDPKNLYFQDGFLQANGERIDLVYNRLTDFYLEMDSHSAIRKAYDQNSIVLTPAPRHHALYANKLNLVALSCKSTLEQINLSSESVNILLNGIPATEEVTQLKESSLWERRRELFFKPNAGYGSKATYRGDKITRRVWDEIVKGEYIAQILIPPSKRLVKTNGEQANLKLDIRVYVYDKKIQLLAARLYSGQTTNFRTDGGGFAPVYVIKDAELYS